MGNFTLDEILRATGGVLLKGGKGVFSGICTDSRTIKPGQLFIPLLGINFDGHSFIHEAKAKGANGSLVQSSMKNRVLMINDDQSFVLVAVEDTLTALQEIASFHRQAFQPVIIAITGSTGKTTCKEMVYSILSKHFKTLKSEGNLNNVIGLPLTLLQLEAVHEIAVLELGMNLRGEIDRMAELAAPTIGVITNIGPSHLQFLGSLKGVLEAKSELIPHINSEGKLILNADDPSIMELSQRAKCQVVTFGLNPDAHFHANHIKSLGLKGFNFRLRSPSGEMELVVPAIGHQNVINALTAIAVAHGSGLELDQIKEGLSDFRPVRGRLEIIELKNRVTLLNDSYNANPKSMAHALETLAEVKGQRRTIAVLGDMLELGEIAKEAHLKIGDLVASTTVDYLIAVGDWAQYIAEGAAQAGVESEQLCFCKHRDEAKEVLQKIIEPGDLILLKASRKIGLDNLMNCLQEI